MNSEIGFGRKVLQVLWRNRAFPLFIGNLIPWRCLSIRMNLRRKSSRWSPVAHKESSETGLHGARVWSGFDRCRGKRYEIQPWYSSRIFAALAHANVNVKMIDQGSSELNVIVGVRDEDFEPAIRAIYDILWKHNSKEFIKNWFSIDKENQFFYNLSVLRHIVHTRHKEYSDRERRKKVDCNWLSEPEAYLRTGSGAVSKADRDRCIGAGYPESAFCAGTCYRTCH